MTMGADASLSSGPGTKETWALAIQYVVGRKRAEDALGFLAEVSSVMASSLDYAANVQEVASIAVPFIGDYCSIDLSDTTGALHQVGLAMSPLVTPEAAPRFRGLLHPQLSPATYGVPKVLRECKREILRTDIAVSPLPEWHAKLSAFDGRSVLIMPVSARGHMFGAISLVSLGAGLGRVYGAADSALVGQVALRIAAAVELAQAVGRPAATNGAG
jgi:GAF domain-containing protein